jgi:hypothetical protein
MKWLSPLKKGRSMMDYGNELVFALILSGPVACITWTITQEEVFQELRSCLARFHSRRPQSWWRQKVAYMPTCPYCFSHYVAGLLVLVLDFHMLVADWRGYVVSLFSLVLIANVYITLYHLLRVTLRRVKTLADRAANPTLRIRTRGPVPLGVASMDLPAGIRRPHQTVRNLSDHRG